MARVMKKLGTNDIKKPQECRQCGRNSGNDDKITKTDRPVEWRDIRYESEREYK